MNILGLNFFHPNAAAALFAEGELVAAAEEERYNRVKFSAGIPLSAIAFCLEQANLEFKDIDRQQPEDRLKFQIPNSKSQTNSKFQIPN